MWELDHKEGWGPKNWYFLIVVLKKTLESPLNRKQLKAVNPKGNQPWIFIGRNDAEVEAPILWPPDAKSWLFGKDRHVGKDWEQEEKGTAEDEMVRCWWWLPEFENSLLWNKMAKNLFKEQLWSWMLQVRLADFPQPMTLPVSPI